MIRACLRWLLLPMASLAATAHAAGPPIRIVADLTDAPRKLFHAEIDIPASPGPLTLTEVKWIPGHHTPVGPAQDMVGIVFTANGTVLPWRRDELDPFQFHLVIPVGASSVHAHVDCIVTARNLSNVVTLQWEKLLLLPAGGDFHDQVVAATVAVPAGWSAATALTPIAPYDVNHPDRQTIAYQPVSAETLQDSPCSPASMAANMRSHPTSRPDTIWTCSRRRRPNSTSARS